MTCAINFLHDALIFEFESNEILRTFVQEMKNSYLKYPTQAILAFYGEDFGDKLHRTLVQIALRQTLLQSDFVYSHTKKPTCTHINCDCVHCIFTYVTQLVIRGKIFKFFCYINNVRLSEHNKCNLSTHPSTHICTYTRCISETRWYFHYEKLNTIFLWCKHNPRQCIWNVTEEKKTSASIKNQPNNSSSLRCEIIK